MVNKKSIALYSIPAILLGVIMVFAFAYSATPATLTNSNPSVSSDDIQTTINYHANVCTSVRRVDGSIQSLGCSHNLLMDAGRNAIKNELGVGGTVAAFNYIALCNAALGCPAPAVSDTTLSNEFATNGLTRALGTYTSLAGNGNWSIAKTFTATADNVVTNKTGLFNQSTTGTMLAENTFTTVTLMTNDQLTINWTITVT